jgi:hypothetical protein
MNKVKFFFWDNPWDLSKYQVCLMSLRDACIFLEERIRSGQTYRIAIDVSFTSILLEGRIYEYVADVAAEVEHDKQLTK